MTAMVSSEITGLVRRRAWLIVPGTVVLVVFAVIRVGLVWDLPAFVYLALISLPLCVIDITSHRLPDQIVLPSIAVSTVLLCSAALLGGSPGVAVRVVLGGGALSGSYFILALLGGVGLGDVKLAAVLGQYLAYLGWRSLVVGSLLAFIPGAIVAALLLAQGARHKRMPFGPFMILAAWAVVGLTG